MKIVFIHPRITGTTHHPLGILYLASVLEKQGHLVKVFDTGLNDSINKIATDVLKENPKIIGISITTAQVDKGYKLAEELKKRSNIPIIFGGVHPTIDPKGVLEKDFIDYVVIGEAEETIVELVNAIKNKGDLSKIKGIGYKKDGIKITKRRKLIEDLDSIPFPALHLLPSRWYFAPPSIRGVWNKSSATMMATRGCPYNCIFCGSHIMFGRHTRFRTVDNVLKEIEYLRKEFGVDAVWFADDTFTINKKWILEFCRELKERNWDFQFGCHSRANTIDEEMVIAMKEAGCVQLDFGIESGSQKILDILKKGITVEQVKKALKITKKHGLRRCTTFIIGTPTETEEDLEMTRKLVKEIKPDYADFFFATPYPHTKLHELALEHGFKEEMPFEKWIVTKHTDEPVMCISMTKEEIIKWRSKLHNSCFVRNYTDLLKNPKFIAGSIKMIIIGWRGIFSGIKRVIKTRKIDSVFIDILTNYRTKLRAIDQRDYK